jgi:hypothetical protein
MEWVNDAQTLFEHGRDRCADFCRLNGLSMPAINRIAPDDWYFDVPAYFRPDTEAERQFAGRGKMALCGYGPGINICVERCRPLATETFARNWSWPGNTADRTPVGVVAHEIGHHADWTASEKKGRYFGNYSIDLRSATKAAPLTSYCENDAEWFAELFRLFITNPPLLGVLRPGLYLKLRERWTPLEPADDWRKALGTNCPARIIKAIENKVRG